MKILFDSSVFIAAFIEAHNKHKLAFQWLERAKNNDFDLIVSAHSLLEVYSVLTSAPFQPPISSNTAKLLIENNIEKNAHIQSLSAKDYQQLIYATSEANLRGGIVYDSLIYYCAKKAKVDKIVTLNAKDFARLDTDHSIEIISL